MRNISLALLLVAAACMAQPTPRASTTSSPDVRPAPMAHMTSMPSRAILLEDIERSRGNVLKYVDIAPDSVLNYRPMAGVRTFAEQIEHAAGANVFILSGAWKTQSAMPASDTAVYRHNKAALRQFVNQSYDAFANMVRASSDQQLMMDGAFMGNSKAGWRWIATALEHTTWTLGQTVPYLRANRVTPPQYLPF